MTNLETHWNETYLTKKKMGRLRWQYRKCRNVGKLLENTLTISLGILWWLLIDKAVSKEGKWNNLRKSKKGQFRELVWIEYRPDADPSVSCSKKTTLIFDRRIDWNPDLQRLCYLWPKRCYISDSVLVEVWGKKGQTVEDLT